MSAIVVGHAQTLVRGRSRGLRFSDAFDIYPWFLGRDYDEHLYAFTVKQLRAQPTPTLGERPLSKASLDRVLLKQILAR
jgi:hypothetical protein